MKKVNHCDFYYQIPENSGFPLSAPQGLPAYMFIDEGELNQSEVFAFLQKIIAALRLQIDENLKIISCHPDSIYPLHSLIVPDNAVIVCFGIKPEQLKLQGFELIHHIYHIKDNRILFANSLQSYSNELSKKILWTQLKQMFSI